ncbi:MAG TPA: hypothetical protein VIM51_14070 [Desulfosporosinus sp.]
MNKLSKTAIVGAISLVSVVAAVGLAGASTYAKSGHPPKKPGIFAEGGGNKIGPQSPMDLNIVAKDLGITLSDLTTDLKTNKSINEVAAAKGVSEKLATLTTDLQTAASEKIDLALKAGKITSDKATSMKANLPKQVQDFLSRKGQGPMERKDEIGFGGSRGLMDMTIVAKALNNMSLTELTTELKSGKSINDVAVAKNLATTQLTKDLTDAASTRIDQAIQAGKLTSDKAKTIKENLPKQVEGFLSSKGHKPMTKMGHKGSSL